MGGRRRFDLFADLILRQFPATANAAAALPIADIAGGKGQLRAAFQSRGIHNITTWDKRRSVPAHKPGFRRAWFDHRTAPNDYGLVLGMHPDEGTDHIVLFAAKNRVPFAVCPCCVKPSAAPFHGEREYEAWCRHVAGLARAGGMRVDVLRLAMKGCSNVVIGRPG